MVLTIGRNGKCRFDIVAVHVSPACRRRHPVWWNQGVWPMGKQSFAPARTCCVNVNVRILAADQETQERGYDGAQNRYLFCCHVRQRWSARHMHAKLKCVVISLCSGKSWLPEGCLQSRLKFLLPAVRPCPAHKLPCAAPLAANVVVERRAQIKRNLSAALKIPVEQVEGLFFGASVSQVMRVLCLGGCPASGRVACCLSALRYSCHGVPRMTNCNISLQHYVVY